MLLRWQAEALQRLNSVDHGSAAIIINLAEQKLYLFKNNSLLISYSVSSSRYGAGCKQDSLCTPIGIHRIAEKIGNECAFAEILKGREPTGEAAKIIKDERPANEDVITSRIMWLQGEEAGLNKGADVDSYERFIYMHGTNEEGLIGQPASIGCIRMKNDDVIGLFNQVEVGTAVLII